MVQIISFTKNNNKKKKKKDPGLKLKATTNEIDLNSQ
jgi:hypothetical protein